MLEVKIITPDTTLFEGQAEMVTLPGTNGSFQILNNHAPIVASLAKGEMKVDKQSFEIKGGIVEVLNNKVMVLV
jgi:F-type H+-transporting ATPase subunit epsilon